jgi:hypothetical protein
MSDSKPDYHPYRISDEFAAMIDAVVQKTISLHAAKTDRYFHVSFLPILTVNYRE